MTDDATDDVYERYRDALQRGHAARRRGGRNAALLAYAEAAAAAPDRPVPYIAMGAVQLTAGRAREALESYDAALRRAPRDVVALRGRAEALALEGRWAAAATTLDVLAETCEAEGRLVDALIAARRGLEMAESRPRRRALADLVDRVRIATVAEAGDDAAIAVVELEAAESLLGVGSAGGPDAESPEVTAALRAAELAEQAELIVGGDPNEARRARLEAVRALAAAELRDAALDAGFRALSTAPDDFEVHLALAEIYASAGWSEHLAAKARVLERFFEIEPHDEERARLAAIVDDPNV
ncbi:MAG TPA: hypothetical protein VJZ72_05405 [Candidatus Limnocylindrales bacterium]|nr:hypothetical protein [Candidatus Limnocylindrales bacterium]